MGDCYPEWVTNEFLLKSSFSFPFWPFRSICLSLPNYSHYFIPGIIFYDHIQDRLKKVWVRLQWRHPALCSEDDRSASLHCFVTLWTKIRHQGDISWTLTSALEVKERDLLMFLYIYGLYVAGPSHFHSVNHFERTISPKASLKHYFKIHFEVVYQ